MAQNDSRTAADEIPPVRILIAPDKFKGALNAREVAQNIAKGLLDVLPDAQIEVVPMADGGEGTAEAICDARGCSWLECKAHDPLGREIDARYGWIDQEKLAVMEMSEAAGMRRLSESERDPIRATTFGVGEMILDATKRGANEIIIGLGGSATNDGGFGMARALGFQFFGEGENEIQSVAELPLLKRIERPKELKRPRIVAVVDVRNPLLGRKWRDTSFWSTERGEQKRPRQFRTRADEARGRRGHRIRVRLSERNGCGRCRRPRLRSAELLRRDNPAWIRSCRRSSRA